MTDQAQNALSAIIRVLTAQRVRKSGASANAVLELEQAFLDAYNCTPIVDDPRVESNASMGREVIVEFPAIWPHRDVTGDSVRLPIRVCSSAGVGPVLEIGPYDLQYVDVKILKAAVAYWDRIEYGPILGTDPTTIRTRETPEGPIDVDAKPKTHGQRGAWAADYHPGVSDD